MERIRDEAKENEIERKQNREKTKSRKKIERKQNRETTKSRKKQIREKTKSKENKTKTKQNREITKSRENKIQRKQYPEKTTSRENKIQRKQYPEKTKSRENNIDRTQKQINKIERKQIREKSLRKQNRGKAFYLNMFIPENVKYRKLLLRVLNCYLAVNCPKPTTSPILTLFQRGSTVVSGDPLLNFTLATANSRPRSPEINYQPCSHIF